MSFCIVCALRRLYLYRRIHPEEQPPFSSDLTRELEDLHRFSFNSLLTLLAVFTLSGSKILLPVVLALLIYTISLRLAVNPCFIQNYPTMARLLHVIPLLGTLCMAGVELVFNMQSPALAVVVLLLSVLPFVTTVLHHGRHYEETPLPIIMRDQRPTMSGYSGTAAIPN